MFRKYIQISYSSEDNSVSYFYDGFKVLEKVYAMIDNCVNELLNREEG